MNEAATTAHDPDRTGSPASRSAAEAPPAGSLVVDGLGVSYGGTSLALQDVSLHVRPGQRVALLGANGAGKTTLVRAATGMTRFHGAQVHTGTVVFAGADITGVPASKTTKLGITQVPEGRQMFGHLTVEENLAFGALGSPKRQTAERMEAALDFFPALQDKRSQHAGLLSGGEQQMVALARALMSQPSVFVIDELTLGLSPVMVQAVVSRLLAVLERTGAALLLVEQNAQLALDVCEYGYVLDRGQIVHAGPAAALAADTSVQDAYLGRRPGTVSTTEQTSSTDEESS